MPLPRTSTPPRRNSCATSMPSSASARPPISAARTSLTTPGTCNGAVANAIRDAGLEAADIDGMLSYSGNDSTMSPFVAGDLGIRLNFYMDVHGGGSSHRGAHWHCHGSDRGRHVQDSRHLPFHERLHAGADWWHRRALRGAHHWRPSAHAGVRLAERWPDVRADVPAPHVRLRHDLRTSRARQGGAQQARLQ